MRTKMVLTKRGEHLLVWLETIGLFGGIMVVCAALEGI